MGHGGYTWQSLYDELYRDYGLDIEHFIKVK
jgi:hypothetical protein